MTTVKNMMDSTQVQPLSLPSRGEKME